jgi:hypothetical protein
MSLAGALARKGAAVTFTAGTAGAYDPLTGIVTGASSVTVSGSAMEIDGDPDLYTALSLIESENPTLLFRPSTVGEVPPLGATVLWGGETFTVKNVKRLAMAGTPTAARVVVGR